MRVAYTVTLSDTPQHGDTLIKWQMRHIYKFKMTEAKE